MIRTTIALLALLAATPVIAQTEGGEASAQAVARLDPDQSFVLFRGMAGISLSLARRPADADWPGYRKARAEAMERDRILYRRRMEEWRPRANQWERMSPKMQARREEPERPVYPTEATVDFPPIELTLMTTVDGFSGAGDDVSSVALKPGTYIVYGMIGPGEFGYAGFCLCMGSVEFDVGEHEIVDLGEILEPRGTISGPPSAGELQSGATALAIVPVTAEQAQPFGANPRWKRAEFRPVGMMPNALGVMVERLAPIPGILSYRRGTPIDERSGSPAAPGIVPGPRH